MRTWLLALACVAFVLAGCSTAPTLPAGGAGDEPTPAAVRAAPDAYVDTRVRWGGRILFIENRDERTLVGVLYRPLDASGRPLADAADGKRFLARVDGFLDPEVYKVDREWSAVGLIDGVTTRAVGEYPYRYPVLTVERHRLWPEREPLPPPAPWYHDPWWPHYGYHPGWPGRYPYWY